MALSAALLDIGGDAMASAIKFAQFHTGAPGAAGTNNVIAGGRFAVVMESTNGNLNLVGPINGTGLTAGATVAYVSLWPTASAGTPYGDAQRTTGDTTVNASGEYTITSLSIPVSST